MHLFVYGTLRRSAGHEMHHVLARHARFAGPATVRGELYSLGAYPGLVHRPDATGLVVGELYEIDTNALDRMLAALDDYEGIGHGPSPDEYRRELIPVTLPDGRRMNAWAYVLNRSLEGLRQIHPGDFSNQ